MPRHSKPLTPAEQADAERRYRRSVRRHVWHALFILGLWMLAGVVAWKAFQLWRDTLR